MAVGVANKTLAEVVAEVARLGGWWRNAGTATAGSTTSLTDANNERTPVDEARSVAGTFIYIAITMVFKFDEVSLIRQWLFRARKQLFGRTNRVSNDEA